MSDAFINEIQELEGLSDEDRRLLADMRPALEEHGPALVDTFYEQLERFEHLREILHAKPGRIEALKGHLLRWLVGLSKGQYGKNYFEERYRIGKRHVEVGLEPRYVIAAMAFCRATAADTIVEKAYGDAPDKEARIKALNKIMDLDLNIMLESYEDHRVPQFLEVTGFNRGLFEHLMAGE